MVCAMFGGSFFRADALAFDRPPLATLDMTGQVSSALFEWKSK